MSAPSPLELCSWKEIAAHLGVSVRTAQLWEQQRGLPVRRLPGPRGQVRAVVPEIEAWKVASPITETSPVAVARPGWRTVGLVAGLVALVGMAMAWAWLRPGVTAVRVEADALAGLDPAGQVLWRHPFGPLQVHDYTNGERQSWVGDLDGDGNPEVLFVPIPAGPSEETVPLVCLDSKGRERWRFTPGQAIRRGKYSYDPTFKVRQFAIIGRRIVVTSHHHLYYPSQVAVLDSAGKLLRQYWHPGHLNKMTPGQYRGKPVVFLGGINNLRHAATLVVLDPERLEGAAVEGGAAAFEGYSAGVEEARILFTRSCLNRTYSYNVVNQMTARDGELVVHVQEQYTEHPPTIQYHFNGELTLAAVSPSDGFLSTHAQQAGHPLTQQESAGLEKITYVKSAR